MKRTPLSQAVLLFIFPLVYSLAYADEPPRWQNPKYVYYFKRGTLGGVWQDENEYRVGTRKFTPGINELHYTDGDVRLIDVASPVLGPFYSKAELCAGCAHLPADVLRQFGCIGATTPPGRKRDWRYLLVFAGGGIAWYLLAQRSAAATQLAQGGTTQTGPVASDAIVGPKSPPTSELAVSGKFLQGSLTDRQFEQLKSIGVDRQTLNAVRNEINKFGENPLTFLTQAVKQNSVVMLDSADQTQYRDYISSILPELKSAGATHLAVESLAQAGQDILRSANRANLKIVPLRPDTGAPEIDQRIANGIEGLLTSGGNNKVIFWGASMFTTRAASTGVSAADLLEKKKFSVITIAVPVEEQNALNKLARDLRSPVAVPTGAAPNMKRFPMTTRDSPGKETLGLWNGLIMVPRPR